MSNFDDLKARTYDLISAECAEYMETVLRKPVTKNHHHVQVHAELMENVIRKLYNDCVRVDFYPIDIETYEGGIPSGSELLITEGCDVDRSMLLYDFSEVGDFDHLYKNPVYGFMKEIEAPINKTNNKTYGL